MSRAILPVHHRPGRHCASTSLCSLANFHDTAFSEAMCFGLGAGLGIWYLDTGKMKPGRIVHVRSSDIEAQFFKRMGCLFSWQKFNNPLDAQDALCRSLDRGLPVMVQTDIYHLPYYNSKTHFPGHDITVWGYDATDEVFLITDTERTDLLSVPFHDMRMALYSENGFFSLEGNQFAPEKLCMPTEMPEVIRRAIVRNSHVILSAKLDFQGIMGLEKWMSELKDVWPALTDWQWTARFAYQVIERRGTGGGGFRLIYADFLKEAELYCPEIASRGLHHKMCEAARAWTALSHALKSLSEQAKPDFREVLDKLRAVHRMESQYHMEAMKLS